MRPDAVTFQPQECSILESPAFVLSSLLLVFATRCHPEPIRAQRGWVKDLLFLALHKNS
jgi:hypothetical protein